MLRSMPSLQLLKHEVRRRICAHCYHRPPGSEGWGPEAARPCELTCPIFQRLPGLRKVAVLSDPMLRPVEGAVRERVDELCGIGADDDAAHRHERLSPLRRYRDELVALLCRAVDD